ncbi:MAG: hypothetical protein EA374_05150 [Acholeplasmatales bacterium]|nr:MAG: hypothetical protein EA374_05150 [Acholeplasmatales bacterium]
MSLELFSLLSILIAVAIGFWKNINVGIIALVFALFIGHYLGNIPINTIIAYWPMRLFFTTVGVTLLFSIARLNGTLENLSRLMIYQSRGRKALIPIIFFVLALVLASIGPGNISTSALLLPIGLMIAASTGISILMMSGLIILGSIAGGLSPIAPNGIVALELARTHGVGELGYAIYLTNVFAITLFASGMFIVLGGLKLNGQRVETVKPERFNRLQLLTLASIFFLVVWVVLTGINVGFAAFVMAFFLFLFKAADEGEAIIGIPWGTLILICGTAVLISVTDAVGGVALLTDFLASLMGPRTAVPILAVLSGVFSIFSSAVGVVMPTLIPTTVSLSDALGGSASPALLTTTIAVGSHITTTSPFSTMGALALASAPKWVDRKKLFRDLFILAFVAVVFIALLGMIGGLGYFVD